MAHPGGRPTKYSPELLNTVEGYLSEAVPTNMKIPTIEGVSLKLGVNTDTINEWAKLYPEFSATIRKLKSLQKEYLTEIGIFGGKEINPTIVALLLKVNHDMVEVNRTELTGKDGEQLVVIKANGDTPVPVANKSN